MFVSSYLTLINCHSNIINHLKELNLADNYESCECHRAGNESLAWGVMMLSPGSKRYQVNGKNGTNHFPWNLTVKCAVAWTHKQEASFIFRAYVQKCDFSKLSYAVRLPSYDTYSNLCEQSL